jgi:DNA-binding MarR family transcriptional regulator
MEQRGLVKRCRGTDEDGRAALVSLTEDGLATYRRSLGPHWQSVKRWFLDGIEPDRLDQIEAILQMLLDHFQHTQHKPSKEES